MLRNFSAKIPPDTRQNHSITPFFSWMGERKYSKRLVGGDKDKKRSLTHCYQGQSRLSLGKFVFIYYQPRQDRVMRNKPNSLNTFPLFLPFSWAQHYGWFPTQNILWYFSPSSTISSSHIASAIPSSSGRGLLTLFAFFTRESFIHMVQSFRVRPLQCVSLMGSQVLQKISSSLGFSLHGPTGPATHVLQCGLPKGSHPRLSRVLGPPWAPGGLLLHHGLPWTAGAYPASPWSTPWAAGASLFLSLKHLLPPFLLWLWCLQSFFTYSHPSFQLQLHISFFPFSALLCQRQYRDRWRAQPSSATCLSWTPLALALLDTGTF